MRGCLGPQFFSNMPLINGSYQYQPLGSPRDAQNQVFGDYTRHDMNDYSQAAYNYLQQQQQQAFELEMWKLKNEYDSPESQMKRYQDAGLNPNLIYGQQNVSGNVPQGSPATFHSSGTMARNVQQGMNMINSMRSIAESAYETWKYFSPYAKTMRMYDTTSAALAIDRAQSDADWYNYITYGRINRDDPLNPDRIPNSMRAGYYNLQANNMEARYRQLVAMVGMIPDQKARLEALKLLDDKRLQIMQGQNDAILNIHTGNATVDSWLRALMYFAMSKL